MWQKKNTTEHKEVVDLRTGMHIIPLIDPDSGAEHKLQIIIGHDSCPHCGHAVPKSNLDELDPKAFTESEIAARNKSHKNMIDYAKKHRVQVRKVGK